MKKHCKRLSSVASSAAAILGSNDDLIIEFLVFVPAKSLTRFQLVSKQWKSIISSSSFHRLHTLRFQHATYSKPQPSFILRLVRGIHYLTCNLTTKTLIRFRFGALNLQYPLIKVLQSCNGLLLLECRVHSGCRNKHYLVFNPTTMRSRNLDLDRRFHRLFLIFDPRKSLYYRVVCFVNYTGNVVFRSVYDSETHKWKDIETESKLQREQVSFATYLNDGNYVTRSFFVCRVFNPEDGSVIRIRKPYEVLGNKWDTYHESNGHMHFVKGSFCRPYKEWNIYVSELSSDDFRWSSLYSVCLDPISDEIRGNYDNSISVLGLIRGEREEDSMMVFHVPGKIMTYKFVAETFETVVDVSMERYFKTDRLQFQSKDVHQLIHTLTPV